jgi:glycosyltransferase involved in cell wall biosynthesis
VAASQGGIALYRSYRIPADRCFYSCLAIDNARFDPKGVTTKDKNWDFLFCGRLEPGKDPEFAMEVALQCALRIRRRVSLLYAGSGTQEAALRDRARNLSQWLTVHFHGFASQTELPALYRSAKIFLFPTRADVWGVVANEACAAGLPVIVSPYAGVAGELIVNENNGFVRPLDISAWTDCAVSLLENPEQLRVMGERSLLLVAAYNFESAAKGIIDACNAAHEANVAYASVSRPV